jgi:alcohol dehydrogenase YqhD (iron-dependent ADH family)
VYIKYLKRDQTLTYPSSEPDISNESSSENTRQVMALKWACHFLSNLLVSTLQITHATQFSIVQSVLSLADYGKQCNTKNKLCEIADSIAGKKQKLYSGWNNKSITSKKKRDNAYKLKREWRKRIIAYILKCLHITENKRVILIDSSVFLL